MVLGTNVNHRALTAIIQKKISLGNKKMYFRFSPHGGAVGSGITPAHSLLSSLVFTRGTLTTVTRETKWFAS